MQLQFAQTLYTFMSKSQEIKDFYFFMPLFIFSTEELSMSPSSNIVITHALRTAIGAFNGAYRDVSATDLGATVIRALLAQSALSPETISHVIMGQVLTALQGQNPARQASIAAGLPHSTPAFTVNQVCGSGLQSLILGYQSIATGQSDLVIAGGQENMTRSPHALAMRAGTKMGNATLTDSMIYDGLWDAFHDYHMGITAENIAERFAISRDAQDAFALSSQQKAAQALASNRFADEIVPVTYMSRKDSITVSTDEFPRPDTSIESLQRLRAAFKPDGTVTAGNASGINDGAAAVLMMSQEKAQQHGLTPMARIVSMAHTGVAPDIMGTGPVPATELALSRAGWSIDDIDIIEANEAFAAQALYVQHTLGLDANKVNVNGGAIALGHPIGASGTRIMVTLLHEMQKRQASKGLATLCVGGGMGVAICVELIS